MFYRVERLSDSSYHVCDFCNDLTQFFAVIHPIVQDILNIIIVDRRAKIWMFIQIIPSYYVVMWF